MDKNTILNYVTETPGNTNRAVLSSMLDSIEGGDGGGLSTASVEFICSSMLYEVYVPSMNDGMFIIDGIFLLVRDGNSVVCDIPLGENGTCLKFTAFANVSEEMPTVTGDIVIDMEQGGFIITGDGTITAEGLDDQEMV